jgi:tRNA G10  N-methylase Trm11
MAQLKQKLAEAELNSLDAKSDDELLNSSVDIEYAMTEVAKLQRQIRETMVYQIGGDLADLYTKVVKRVGLIQEQQEAARLIALRKKRDEQWLRDQQAAKRHKRMAIAAIAAIVVAETWGLMAAIVMANT